MKPCRTHCLGEFPSGIAARAHFGDGPVAKAAVVHGEAVVMLGDRNDVFRTRFLEQLGPCCRIELLGLEHWEKVLVAELVLPSVSRDMVLVFFGSFAIHISRIPFVAEGRHRIRSPVDEDPELCVLVPLGCLVFLEGFPVRAKRALMIGVIHLFEAGGAFAVVLAAGLLPYLINLDRIL